MRTIQFYGITHNQSKSCNLDVYTFLSYTIYLIHGWPVGLQEFIDVAFKYESLKTATVKSS